MKRKEREELAESGRGEGHSGVYFSLCQGRASGCLLSCCSPLGSRLSDAR